MRTLRLSLALLLAAPLLAACGKDNGQTAQPDAGSSTYGLALVGDPLLKLHPGDVRSLQVVLAQTEVGPVPGKALQLSIEDGDPAGALLDTTAPVTSSGTSTGAGAGVATFKLTAGATTHFKVVASTPLAPGRTVAFSIDVVPVKKILEIVGSPQISVAPDGESASTSMYVASSLGLKVNLIDGDTTLPIAGVPVSFTITGTDATGLSFSGASAKSASAVTSASGDAQVFVVAGQITGKEVIVASAAGTAQVSWGLTVTSDATSGSCTSSQQCPAGQICTAGVCTTPSTGGGATCGGGNDQPCPFGYTCVGGTCQPPINPSCDPSAANACPNGQTCACTGAGSAQTCTCQDICPVCTTGTHCNVNTQTCVPDTVPTPDASGLWYTQHDFALSQGLPGVVQTMQKIVAIMDQLVNGVFFTGVWSWLNSIVKSIIDQYVPSWVATTIKILDAVGTFLSNLRAEGAMRLTAGADTTHYRGTEVWTSLVFYYLPLCPNGRPAGDPTLPPDCARFDVATSDSDTPGDVGTCKGQSVPAISVQVAPFTSYLTPAAPSAGYKGPWSMGFDQRQVKLKFGKVVLMAINLLISYLTEYNCIDEALDCVGGNSCLIDCTSLGQTISDALGGLVSPDFVTAVCQPVVTAAGQEITTLLTQITFTSDVLDFNGQGAIPKWQGSSTTDPGYDPNYDPSACDSGTLCAMQLGQDTWDYNLVKGLAHDGSWNGSFFGVLKQPGAFRGQRGPLVH
jgi:hypothetical protein